jgi:hypothetical protein
MDQGVGEEASEAVKEWITHEPASEERDVLSRWMGEWSMYQWLTDEKLLLQ